MNEPMNSTPQNFEGTPQSVGDPAGNQFLNVEPPKRKSNKLLLGIMVTVVILLIVGAIIFYKQNAQIKSDAAQNYQVENSLSDNFNEGGSKIGFKTSHDEGVSAFIGCVNESGAKLYGASWSPRINAQINIFGDSDKSLSYIDCTDKQGNIINAECKRESVTAFPTWKFKDGKTVQKTLSLGEIATYTGCKVPVVIPKSETMADMSQWKVYSEKKLAFSFKYPEYWRIDNLPSSSNSSVTLMYESLPSELPYTSVTTNIRKLSTEVLKRDYSEYDTLENWLAKEYKDAKAITLLDHYKQTVNGTTYYVYKMKNTPVTSPDMKLSDKFQNIIVNVAFESKGYTVSINGYYNEGVDLEKIIVSIAQSVNY